jgi:predicted Zn-dependent protease with MMP-like domain
MELSEFERRARLVWDDIPAQYKQGVDGLVIEAKAHAHPQQRDFFTLGECVTEAYPSDFGGPDTIRSAVVLYYGSFRRVAEDDEAFDWEEEIHETILHELQHHLESLADDDQLSDLDYAVEQNFRRADGQSFDPLFYRAGELMGAHTYRVEHDVFVEIETNSHEALDYELQWQGRSYRVAIPASSADVLFTVLAELPGLVGELAVVRVRRRGVLGTLRAALTGSGYSTEETLIAAQPL